MECAQTLKRERIRIWEQTGRAQMRRKAAVGVRGWIKQGRLKGLGAWEFSFGLGNKWEP